MWVFGLSQGYFISYDPRLPEGEDLFYVEIKRNDDDLSLLAGKLLQAISLRDEWVADGFPRFWG